MTDPQIDDLEELQGMMSEPKKKCAVLTMMLEPTIKIYFKAPEINESHQASLFLRSEIDDTDFYYALAIPHPRQWDRLANSI